MKKGITGGVIGMVAALFCLLVPPANADSNIYWDFDNGFSPSAVEISPGEKVIWWNVDPFGFDVRITFDAGLTFFLANFHGQSVTFPNAGSYGFHSDFGDTGLVTVSVPTPPAISLDAPRLEEEQFLFDATGLTVGKTNVLQVSINLASWTSISTNIAADTSMTFTNATSLPSRFFRLIELP